MNCLRDSQIIENLVERKGSRVAGVYATVIMERYERELIELKDRLLYAETDEEVIDLSDEITTLTKFHGEIQGWEWRKQIMRSLTQN